MYLKSLNRTKILSIAGLFISIFIFQNARAQMRQVFVDHIDEDNHARKISFYSPNEGYVAFTKWIGYTADSGRTFERKYISMGNVNYNGYNVNLTFGFGISGVKAFSKDTLLAYGDYGTVPAILYSTNGGSGWLLIYHTYLDLDILTRGVTDMVFPGNGNIGYAVEFDRIIKSTNRGQTWSVLSERNNHYFDYIEAVDQNTAFAYSVENVKALVKITGGNFSAPLAIPENDLRCLNFLTPDKGWLNSNDKIFYTSNGGISWTQKNNIPVNFTKIKFLNDSVGYGIAGREVYKTTDSGKVWERMPRDIEYEDGWEGHLDLNFWNANQFWAAGGHGLVELTTNGGGIPRPTAGFTTDTAGLYNSKTVKLTNWSKPTYSYQWFKNDTLVATTYNATFTRGSYPLIDTVKLVVSNGTYTDTAIQYLYYNAPVKITSFTPTSGADGATITIRGSELSTVNAVYFGKTAAQSFQVISNTEVRAVVLLGSSGAVKVFTPNRGIDSMAGFIFIPAPVVQTITPMRARAGQTVTLSGYDLNGVTEVKFANINATSFTVVNSTTITAVVPSGVPGIVSVRSPGGQALFNGFVILPDLISFTPDSGTLGTLLEITGTSLSRINAVTVGGVPAQSFTVHSALKMSAVVSTGASGDVIITSPDGADTLGGFTFYPKPVVNTISPTTGPVGTSVTISGMFFDPVAANNIVYFGNVRAVVTAASANSLTATVPAGATLDPVSVTVNNRSGYSKQSFNVTFTGGGYITPNSLTKQQWSAGSGRTYHDLAPGDFDGDGKTDLAVINYSGGNGTVTVARNTSAGNVVSFNPVVNFAMTAPKKLAVGDVDGDGKLDLAVTDSLNNVFNYYRNTSASGNISFASPMVVSTLPTPVDIAITDVDLDGKTDVIVSASGLTVFRNYGSAGVVFDSTILATSCGDLLIKDVDMDGRPDIIATDLPFDLMGIMPNLSTPGHIRFGTAIDPFYSTSSLLFPSSADLNNDQTPDIVSFDGVFKQLKAFSNESTPGAFSIRVPTIFGSGFIARSVALSDLDGDGKPDMLVAQPDQNFTVHRNTSTTGALPSFEVPVPFSPGNYMAEPEIEIADFDNDGKPDPVVVNEDGTQINIYVNKGIPKPYIISFTPTSGAAGTVVTIKGRYFNGVTSVSFGGVAASSFNIVSDTSITATVGMGATGKIIVTNSFGSDSLGTFVYGTTPLITSFSPASGPIGTVITISGSNFRSNIADNILRIGGIRATITAATSTTLTAIVPPGQSVENISVSVNGLTGYSSKPFIVTFASNSPGFTQNSFMLSYRQYTEKHGGTVADLDNDGKQDIIYLVSGYGISVAKNNSTPGRYNFTTGTNYFAGDNSLKVVAGDLDGDGLIDAAVLDGAVNSFGIYRNTSNATNISFAPKISYTIGTEISAGNNLVIRDLDGDGRPDIVASNFNSHVVKVFKNLSTAGNINFVFDSEYEVAGQPQTIETGDLDGDNKPEIAVGVFYAWGRKGVFKNTSTSAGISFEPYLEFGASTVPQDLLIKDFNYNGRQELLTSHWGPSIWLQEYNGSNGNLSFEHVGEIRVDPVPANMASGDLDGDGREDLLIANNLYSFFALAKNNSQAGQLSISDTVQLPFFDAPSDAVLADMDLDGALDVVGLAGNSVNIYQNLLSGTSLTVCPGTDTTITQTVAGTQFQWQTLHPEGYFIDIGDNANISGTKSRTLVLTDVPASMHGMRLQCIVDGTQRGVAFTLYVNGGGSGASPEVTINGSDTAVCTGSSLTFTATATNAGPSVHYQWQLNGANVGTNSNQYTTGALNASAELRVILTGTGGCGLPATDTSKIVIQVSPPVSPVVAISTSATSFCPGTPVTFTATPTNGGTDPSYQWFVNGNSVGTDSAQLTTTYPAGVNEVRVVMTSNAGCVTRQNDSTILLVRTDPAVVPTVTVAASAMTVCAGTNVTFTATPGHEGTTPVYQWKKNGVNVGTNNPVYSDNTLIQGDSVTVTMTSNAACASPITVTSAAVRVMISAGSDPGITISGNTDVNSGDQSTISAAVTNAGTNPSYQWQDSTSLHGWQDIAGATGVSHPYQPASSGDRIRCKFSSTVCSNVRVVFSNVLEFNLLVGGKIAPNPVTDMLNIMGLKLTDNWETVEIANLATGSVIMVRNITNQTSVSIPVSQLSPGVYVAILKRSSGPPAHLRFIK